MVSRSLALSFLFASGCAWISQGELEGRLDWDGDGYESAEFGGDDCDDEDELINPEGTETCNDADDDCNGLVDDVTAYYKDGDADGWGDDTQDIVWGCSRPQGYSDKAGDCDDADNNISPSATEKCNGVDDDCDGKTDGDDPDITC